MPHIKPDNIKSNIDRNLTIKKTLTEDKVPFSVAYNFTNTDKKQKKPVTNFQLIRSLADVNSIVQVCKDTLKNQISNLEFKITTKNKKDYKEYEYEIDYATNLFSNPNENQTFREFWQQVLEDVLVIDRGAIENVYNKKGELVEFYQVDGSTIRPRVNPFGEFEDDAYIQIVQDKIVAKFTQSELDIIVNNPRSTLDSFGYGKSPVEKVLMAVITNINSDKFNSETFTKSSLPPYWINIPGMNQQQLKEFSNAWSSGTEGNMWKAMFTGNRDGIELQKLRDSNQDMQYYELSLWMTKIIIAAFEISPQDIGLTMDVNKANGETQYQLSKTQGLRSLVRLVEEWHNKKLRVLATKNPKFLDLVFHFNNLDKLDDKTQSEIDKTYIDSGVYTVDYIRNREGLEIEDEDKIKDDIKKELKEKEDKENTEDDTVIENSTIMDEHLKIKSSIDDDIQDKIAQEVNNILYG